MTRTADDLALLQALAERVALGAAELLLDGMPDGPTLLATKSSGTDLVTDMDRAAERFIVDGILSARPDDGILGEEGTDVQGTTGVQWVIDPLDGTTNYVYGHPGYSVSIAALVDGRPSVAAVADPVHDDLFSARAGAGALRNQVRIRCSEPDSLAHALVATGFSYLPDGRAAQAEVLGALMPHIRDIRRMGGAAVDLCSTACGRVDAYYERGLQPWDLAAGALIAQEAGARVGDIRGAAASGDFVLASPPALFEPLAELLRSAGADRTPTPSDPSGDGASPRPPAP